jgi:hypothetical protein
VLFGDHSPDALSGAPASKASARASAKGRRSPSLDF